MSVKNTKARDFAKQEHHYLLQGKHIETVKPLTLSDVKKMNKAPFVKAGHDEIAQGEMHTAKFVPMEKINPKDFSVENCTVVAMGTSEVVKSPEPRVINAEIRRGMMSGGYGNQQYSK